MAQVEAETHSDWAISRPREVVTGPGLQTVARLMLLGFGMGAVIAAASDLNAPSYIAGLIAVPFACIMVLAIMPGIMRFALAPGRALRGVAALTQATIANLGPGTSKMAERLREWTDWLTRPSTLQALTAPATTALVCARLDPEYVMVFGGPDPEAPPTTPLTVTALRSAPEAIVVRSPARDSERPYRMRLWSTSFELLAEAASPQPEFPWPTGITLEPALHYTWEVRASDGPTQPGAVLARGVFWLLSPDELAALARGEAADRRVEDTDLRALVTAARLLEYGLADECIAAATALLASAPTPRASALARRLLAYAYLTAHQFVMSQRIGWDQEAEQLARQANEHLADLYESVPGE